MTTPRLVPQPPDPGRAEGVGQPATSARRSADDEAWRSTTTTEELAGWIRSLPSVLILTHVKPDGDAIGSAGALTRAINLAHGGAEAGISGVLSVAEAWFSGPFPPWASRVTSGTKLRVLGDGETADNAIPPAGIVVVDTGAWVQLAPFESLLRRMPDRAAVIDHHLSGNAEIAKRRIIRTDAAAAAEIVADVACALLGLKSPAELPLEVAEPLYLGICTDTGWFRHSNVSASVLRTAASLLEAGVRPGPLFEVVEQQDRPSRLRLLRRALERLEWHDDHAIALIALSADDFRDTGAAPGDTGGFHELIKSISEVRVTAILTEASGGAHGPLTKVSLRSKAAPEQFVDVNRATQLLGGGGHAQAAGARVHEPLDLARTSVLEAIREVMNEVSR